MWLVEAGLDNKIVWGADEVDELWSRWRGGESLRVIGRELGRPRGQVERLVLRTGGVRPPERRAAADHLQPGERESISRGLAAGRSARSIAVELGRNHSTVSREVARHGGRELYRAEHAQARRAQPAPPEDRQARRGHRAARSGDSV